MASEGGGKFKQKRNQTPNKPYERKSSLFGKLKDSVKDLLIPSWLSGTPDVKREKTGDKATPQHSNEDVRQGGRTGQVINDWSHGSAFQANNRTAPAHLGGPSFGNSSSVKLPGSNIPGFGYQPPNGELRTDQSTSLPLVAPSLNFGLGAQTQQQVVAPNINAGGMMIKHSQLPDVHDCVDQRYSDPVDNHPQDFGVTPIRPVMVSTGVRSSSVKPDAKRQRLWSPEPLRQGRPLVPPPRGKPTFNTLLFGTPSKGDSSTLSSSFGDSSFYVGKTCYGGASSVKRKSTMNTSLPYQSSLPLRKQVKATKLNSTLQATTSSTAQRILDTLERISTPLEDAKKIPQGDQDNDSVLSFTPSSYRRQTSRCSAKPITRPLHLPNRGGPPTNQLQSTPQVDIARNRDRSRPTRLDSDSVLSMTQETVSVKGNADNNMSAQLASGSCKIKTKKFSQHVSGRQEEEDVVIPNLKTDFVLPLSSMTPIVFSQGNNKSAIGQVPNVALSSKSGGASPPKFTFATPIEEKNRPLGSQFGQKPDQGFKFSSPIHVSPGKASAAGAEEGSKYSPEPAVGAATPAASMWAPQMMKPKALSPDIGGTSSSFKSYTKWNGSQKNDVSNTPPAVGLPVATTLKKGSVMDILGGLKTTSSDSGKIQVNNTAPLSAMFKNPPGSWECDTCMIQNKADTNRCVACSALKPGSKPNNASVVSNQDKPLSALFKNPEGSWECGTCMIQNNASANKCIACTSPKPGPKAQNKGQGSSGVPLSEMFKKPEGSWECSTCMIQNSSSAAKCVACETPKPVAKKGPTSSDVPLSQLFQKPAGSWECDTCMIQNTQSAVKCVACETPKPRAKAAVAPTSVKGDNSLAAMFKRPEGSWECDTCMVQNSATALRCIACTASKPGLQSAGIVSKPSTLSSSIDNQIVVNAGGGFSVKLPSTTTTTTGSAGFKFGTSDSVISSNTASFKSTGFSLGNKDSQKDNSSVNNSSNNTSNTIAPSTGGFKFGSSSSSSSSGNGNSSTVGGFKIGATVSSPGASVSSSSNISIPSGGGFKFGTPAVTSNTSSSSSSSIASVGFSMSAAADASKPTGGFQFGAPTTPSSSDSSASKAGFTFNNNNNESSQKTAVSISSQKTTSISSSFTSNSFTADNNTSNNKTEGGFQFSALPSSLSSSEKKSETNGPPSQPTFAFGATPATSHSQTTTGSSPFVFGAPPSSSSAGPPNAVGLGMGQSLASSVPSTNPMVNGAFGASHDAKNSLAASNTGFTSGFAFGSKQPSITKRPIDNADHGAPSAKATPVFGALPKEPAVNGGFNFNANAGSFAFGSSQAAQPAAGGFQFSANPSGPATPATGGFSFNPKPSQAAQPAKTNEVSFNATPNYNFSASQSDGSAVFQFGSKPAQEQPAPSTFSFGAASSTPTATPSIPNMAVFGAAPAAGVPNAVGGFNIGAADTSQRKVKKAVRRIKR